MTAIEGVFFDLDGTLLDTAEDFVVAMNQMLHDYQQPLMDARLIRSTISAGSKILVQKAFKLPDGTELEQKRKEFLSYYDQHIRNEQRHSISSLYPGMEKLITELEQRHIIWGIVTNKPRTYAVKLLEQLNLLERTQTLICPEDVSKAKPDPEPLFLACQQTRCNPKKSVYIGDHIRDIEAGRQAGMLTVAAHYGYIAEDDDPHLWQADLNIHQASELHHWLQESLWQIPERSGVEV